jgi:hypothetical protein
MGAGQKIKQGFEFDAVAHPHHVTRRSYLDAGTEAYPGSTHYTHYAFPPNARGPLDFYLPIEAAQSSLPHPWWLRSYHAPLGILIALVRSRVT